MAQTDYYVNYSTGTDGAGNGSSGTPYKTIQYALDDIGITHGTGTDGDRLLLDTGTTHVLSQTLDLDSYGATPSSSAPLSIHGDGGRAVIDAGGYQFGEGNSGTYDFDSIHLYNLEIYNGPAAAALVELGTACSVVMCELHQTDDTPLEMSHYGQVMACDLYDYDSWGIDIGIYSKVCNCFLHDGPTYSGGGIFLQDYGAAVNNILHTDGAGIDFQGNCCLAIHNTLLHLSGGTSTDGIRAGGSSFWNHMIANNIICGFTNGIDFESSDRYHNVINNTFYNCTNKFVNDSTAMINELGTLEPSDNPLAERGPLTYANRYAYFEPVGTSRGAAYPYST